MNNLFDYKRARRNVDYWQEWNCDPARVLARHAELKVAIRENIACQNETKRRIGKLDDKIVTALIRHVVERGREIGDGRDYKAIAPKSHVAREMAHHELQTLERIEDRLFAEVFALEWMYPVFFVDPTESQLTEREHMDTERTQEIARIRARVEADYRVANGNRALYATELAITDLRTLLAELDRLQAVVAAAYEMRKCITYRDVMYEYANPDERLQKWDDALAQGPAEG